jgi:peptidoglycan-associated lipoprotein
MLVSKDSLLKVLVASLGFLGFSLTSCTDDEKSVESPVTSASMEHPASPVDVAGFSAETVYFAFDSSHLDHVTQQKLDQLAQNLVKNGTARVEIAGHTDERGTTEYNLALGERRAAAVQKYLSGLGVDVQRITTISYGEERPAVEGHNESAWSKNRRSEFTLSR